MQQSKSNRDEQTDLILAKESDLITSISSPFSSAMLWI